MDFRGYIEVTEVDPRLLVQVAYSGSRPQGLGFLHHKPGGLDEETLNEIIKCSENEHNKGQINLDYVHGRAMKFSVHVDRDTGKKYVDLDWYDHSREALKHVVRECGVPDVEARIAKAEAEKDEQAQAWEAKQERYARLFVEIVAKEGGNVRYDKPPFKEYYKLAEDDPILLSWCFGRERAIKNGWITRDPEWREFTITDAGRAMVVP
jgi:hypothetical protein